MTKLSAGAATRLVAALGTMQCLTEHTPDGLAIMDPDQLHQWLQETRDDLQKVFDDHLYDDPYRSQRVGES